MGFTAYLAMTGLLASYLLSYCFSRQVERRFHGGNQTANYSIWKWVPLHYHMVVEGHLGPKSYP
jgi:hypothetical protein